MRDHLYRKNALQHRGQELDGHAVCLIAEVSIWRYIILLMLAIAAFLVWLLMFSFPIYVHGKGMAIPLEQVKHARFDLLGERERMMQRVKRLKSISNHIDQLYTKHYVTVDVVDKAQSAYMRAEQDSIINGENISEMSEWLNLSHINQESMIVVAFVDASTAKSIKEKMHVTLKTQFNHHVYNGLVTSISTRPVSKYVAGRILHNHDYVAPLFRESAPFMVIISLQTGEVDVGAILNAAILVKKVSPIQMILSGYRI